MVERAKDKTYGEDEAKARLEAELPHWYLEDGWIRRRYRTNSWKGTLMVINAVGPSGRGGVAPSRPHRVLRLGRGPADEPRPQGHHRQGFRAGEEDRGGGALAAGARAGGALEGTPRTTCASPTSSTTSPRPDCRQVRRPLGSARSDREGGAVAEVARVVREVVCPFCSLACDDLEVAVDGARLRCWTSPVALPAPRLRAAG